MKNYLLMPSKYKVFGWITFSICISIYIYCNFIYTYIYDNGPLEIPGFSIAYADVFLAQSTANLTNALLSSGILIGLLLISFSREPNEDEYISFLRLRSWQWAVLISYGILFIANWLIYGYNFFLFMIFNMLTVLIVFIIKFQYSLYRLTKERITDEE